MPLELKPPLEPMEALEVDQIPGEGDWQFEPKWDGFRAVVFRDSQKIELQSKAGQPLERYFPELVAALAKLKAKQFVLDAEIVLPQGDRLAFDQLLQRIHPAESRIKKLAHETPALLIVFDLLADEHGKTLVRFPLSERRKRLEKFAARYFGSESTLRLSPASTDQRQAKKWFDSAGSSLDGVMAKRRELPYQSGNRLGMLKIKPVQAVECVVGGFRYGVRGRTVGSLLLGLYNDQGLLDHVGYTSALKKSDFEKLTPKLEKLVKPPGFTGKAPGGPSRWSTKRSSEWQPLAPKLVVEVAYDHFTGGRFRHGTRFLRWRPDKPPKQCTFKQLARRGPGSLNLLKGAKSKAARNSAKVKRAAKST